MKNLSSKKKYLAAAILVSALAFTITHSATARPNQMGYQSGPCQQQQLDPVTQKAQEKLMSETVELRKQMVEKKAAMRAVMAAETPDATKASKLAGELFDLKEQFRTKAQEYGFPTQGMGRNEMTMTKSGGAGKGQGKGKGFRQ